MSGLTPTQVRDLVLEAQRDYGRLANVPLDFYGALLTAARAAAPSVEPEGHTHRWLDGEFLLNGCQLPHVVPPDGAARVVVDGPRAAPPSPEPTPGLREALREAIDYARLSPTGERRKRWEAALAASPAPEPTGLDAAWSEAEAALPEGWAIQMVWGTITEERWGASAGPWPSKHGDRNAFGGGETPAAALRALAALLREREA